MVGPSASAAVVVVVRIRREVRRAAERRIFATFWGVREESA